MDVDNYRKLLRDNITSTYKKADKSLTKKINQVAKHIAEKLKLDQDRMFSQKEFLHNFKRPQRQLLQQPLVQTN